MTELDFLEGFRFFLMSATILAGIGTVFYAYHQPKAANLPTPKHGRAIVLCGIALSGVLAITSFVIDTEIISRQERAMMSLESGIEVAELRARGPLDDNKLAILSTAIKPFAGTAYEVAVGPCADGNLVMKLNKALSASQWKFVGASLPATAASQADAIKIQYSHASKLKSAIDTLTEAMRAAGLNPTSELVDSNSAAGVPNMIRIFIGGKSP